MLIICVLVPRSIPFQHSCLLLSILHCSSPPFHRFSGEASISKDVHVVVWSVVFIVANTVDCTAIFHSLHVSVPTQLRLFSVVQNTLHSCTPSFFLMSSFYNLSVWMKPLVSLGTFVSPTCTLIVVADVNVHVSQLNARSGCRILLYIINLAAKHLCILWIVFEKTVHLNSSFSGKIYTFKLCLL